MVVVFIVTNLRISDLTIADIDSDENYEHGYLKYGAISLVDG
jgi:hypothetical protein